MKVKSPFDEPRVLPWLGGVTVEPGAVVAVPDEHLDNYLEAGWTPADDRTLAAARELDATRVKAGKAPRLPEKSKSAAKSAGEGEQ